jgi:glycerol-1-phosphate dehydrogenase [NAD(P)+]
VAKDDHESEASVNLFEQVEDPTNLELIRSVIAASERPEALVPLGIRQLQISSTASENVVESLRSLLEQADQAVTPQVVVLVDATPIFKGAVELKASVIEELKEHFEVKVAVLGDEHHLYADDSALDAATAAVKSAAAVVSIGSGTISDIAKVATNRVGNIPYVMVQTAASVDGYTDNVSVVLRSGAKRTIDSRWPDVVLADTEVIASAPRELNTSGFGELLSLFTAPADWWLASQVGTDKTFHTTPRDLLLTFAGNPSEWGVGIADGDRAAVEQLTRVLAIRGIGTGIAGTTACLSGMEHLVSHMLDMFAAANGHEIGLHGAQVGVASVVTATAWEYLLEQIRAGRAIENEPANAVILKNLVQKVFETIDTSGALGAECWRDYSAKLAALQNSESNFADLGKDAQAIVTSLGATLPNSRDLATGLARAGAVVGYRQLAPWVTDEVWRWAVGNCLFMRNRVTIVDFLNALGWWTASDVTEVLARVDALTGEVAHV